MRPYFLIQEGAKDIAQALRDINIALLFGWQDIAQRYRRSRVGAFWLTINKLVMIGALGVIFGTLFRANLREYLPFVACGVVLWGYIFNVLNEGSTTFISSNGIILQVDMPMFIHILRMWWKNVIILCHDIVILPILLILFTFNPGWALLLFIPGFILVTLNLLWISLFLSTLSTRYRDMPLIITNILQVAFYATPIMWQPKLLPEGTVKTVLELNPFYHMLSLLRDPILGHYPSLESWLFTFVTMITGWLITLCFFGRYRWRIAYWL